MATSAIAVFAAPLAAEAQEAAKVAGTLRWVLHALLRPCPSRSPLLAGYVGWDWTRGWRATFYTTGMVHSPTSPTGTGWERTPWHAVQSAAWDALRRSSSWWGQVQPPTRAGRVFVNLGAIVCWIR
jgi:hypothetical protein